MSETTKKACCVVGEKLDPRKLTALDAELRTQDHRSFRRLALAFGLDRKAIEKHKHRCLKLAMPMGSVADGKAPPPRELPPVVVANAEDHARVRAPESANDATSREKRIYYIVSHMAAGTWDGPRDISALAATWGLERDTVRGFATEAATCCRVDRGTVEERREAAMGYWRRVYETAMAEAASPGEMDTASKNLAVAASAQTGWDKAAGLYDDASKTINIFGDPRFVEAAKRYVSTVQDVLGGAGALAERVRAQLGEAVPLEVIAAVLAAADDAIAERVAGPQPKAIGMGT